MIWRKNSMANGEDPGLFRIHFLTIITFLIALISQVAENPVSKARSSAKK